MSRTLRKKTCRALVIGGSAGSLEPLLEIIPLIKHNISFPILLIIHRKPSIDSLLSELLQNKTTLKVCDAEEKTKLQAGTIYVAAADYHLLIEENETISLDYSEKINYSRPSIDVTFQSAAEIYKENLVCILLSGSNADGALGLKSVNHYKGTTAIQNPNTAKMPYMPEQALLYIKPDAILNASEIADYINQLNI